MKTRYVLLSLLFFSGIIFPQMETYVLLTPSGFPISSLSGYGNSALLNSAANAGSLNPAALNYFDEISLGVSYQYETEVDKAWGGNTKGERIFNFFPQSFGIVIPVKNFCAALSMNQLYNNKLNFHVPLTTSIQPFGTGEFMDFNYQTKLISYSLTTSYSIKNIKDGADLSIGARFGYNHLQHRSEDVYYYIDDSFSAYNYSVGFMISKFKEDAFIKFGVFYNSALKYDEEVDINWIEEPIYDHPDETVYPKSSDFIVVTKRLTADIPSSLRFDFHGSKSEKIEFTGSFTYRFWKNIGDNFKNQPEAAGNLIYNVNEIFKTSLGLNYTDRNFEDFPGFNENLHSVYFMLGGVLKMYGFDLHFVLADNRLFSGDYVKKTIVKAGLNYEF